MECRDSLGYFNQSLFNLWTCSLCYTYLFPKDKLVFNYDRQWPGLEDNFRSIYSPNIENVDSLTPVCGYLDLYDCERWKECCTSARACCQQQINTRPLDNRTDAKYCPRTWDGWSCFGDTLAGTTVEKSCPNFIKYGYLQGNLVKECTINATWARHEEDNSGNEWTDYSKCIDIKGKKGVVYAGLLSASLSLILLIPATVIFLSYRQLRSQQRIQLHVCLLCSFIVYSIMKLIWVTVVYNNRIDNPWQDTFMVRKENLCKIVYVLWRYARCTTFFSMFCEGLFLYRLLVHAFNSPKHIKPYFVVAWVFPILPIFVYSLMRGIFANDIRALRATFVLVPLFGLQLFFVIYRPKTPSIQDVYEIVTTIISDLQGGIIALVFCYFNGEVIHCIKVSLTRLRNSKRLPSFATSYSVVTQKMDAEKNKQQNCSANPELVQLEELSKRNGTVKHEENS